LADQGKQTIAPEIYGHFAEHLRVTVPAKSVVALDVAVGA